MLQPSSLNNSLAHDERRARGAPRREVYVVLRGAADFTAGKETFPARTGSEDRWLRELGMELAQPR